MSTIVEHWKTGKRFVVVGSGLSPAPSARSESLETAMNPPDLNGRRMIAVADLAGNVIWIPADEIQVVSVAGNSPRDLLNPSSS